MAAVAAVVAIAGIAALLLVLAGGREEATPRPARSNAGIGEGRTDTGTSRIEAARPRPDSARDGALPALPPEKREELAKDSLRKARDFASANPGDLVGQRSRFEEAAWNARETSLQEQARAELKALEKRQLEALAPDLASVDEKVRPALDAEDFAKAIGLLEEAKKRRSGADWTGAIDRRIAQTNEAAATLFLSLKPKVLEVRKKGSEADLQAIRERVRKWGLAAWSAELEKALADAAPPSPPPEPKPAPVEPASKSPPAPAKRARGVVPESAQQREAEIAIRKNYALDQAKTPKDKSELARTLLRAATSGSKDVELYVLLRLARALAVQGGDARTALEAIDAVASGFEVDAASEKVELFAKATVKGAEAMSWGSIALQLSEAAAEGDDYDAAIKLAAAAEALGRAGVDKFLQEQAKERSKEFSDQKRLAEDLRAPLKTLETTPEDPAANSAVGKYLVLFKRDWARGLPMLAMGSDPSLKALAAQELATPADAAAQAALGEAWAALADKDTPAYRTRERTRAVEWLGRAIPGLMGPAKTSAERKLAALGPLSGKKEGLIVDLGEGVRMEFVLLRPGVFLMGSPEPPKEQGFMDERPEHRVTITKPFYLGKYEVTRRQFAAFAKATGYKTDVEKEAQGAILTGTGFACVRGASWQDPKMPGQTDDCAVTFISWNDARAFCEWASKKTGKALGLPTEAEWEYACRAGTKTRWSFGDAEGAIGEFGWTAKNSGNQIHPVGLKRPNSWGLFDMYGNVWEWCQDFAGGYNPDAVDPKGPASGEYRILRGGSCLDGLARSAVRLPFGTLAYQHCGFRVAIH
jgi:formylglycine-generating enzyme required for sulfatase activity